MNYCLINSPIGLLTMGTDGTAITGLHIAGDRYFTHVPADWVEDPALPVLQQAAREIDEYFAGRRTVFTLPLAVKGTSFQRAVWEKLATIPSGETITYADIARQIGNPGAVRAVGTAVGRNPICILLPCHRVLASDGSLGGYVAGIERKKALLGLEGVAIVGS